MRPRQLTRIFTSEVMHKTVASVDEYGQPTTSSATIQARVVRNHVRSVDDTGEDFVSTTQIQTLASITVGDLLTIDGVDRRVRSVKQATGVRGGATVTEAML